MASREIQGYTTGGYGRRVDFVDFWGACIGGFGDLLYNRGNAATQKSTLNPSQLWKDLGGPSGSPGAVSTKSCERIHQPSPPSVLNSLSYHVLSFYLVPIVLSSIDPASISYRQIFKTFVRMVESI